MAVNIRGIRSLGILWIYDPFKDTYEFVVNDFINKLQYIIIDIALQSYLFSKLNSTTRSTKIGEFIVTQIQILLCSFWWYHYHFVFGELGFICLQNNESYRMYHLSLCWTRSFSRQMLLHHRGTFIQQPLMSINPISQFPSEWHVHVTQEMRNSNDFSIFVKITCSTFSFPLKRC